MAFLPVGYKLEPTKEELVGYFLRMKDSGQPLPINLYPQFIEYNIYTNHPFRILCDTLESRSVNGEVNGLEEGYFFTKPSKVSDNAKKNKSRCIKGHGTWQEKEATTPVLDFSGRRIGNLKYYKFKPDSGSENDSLNKDEWCMHEYSLVDKQDDYVLAHLSFRKTTSR